MIDSPSLGVDSKQAESNRKCCSDFREVELVFSVAACGGFADLRSEVVREVR